MFDLPARLRALNHQFPIDWTEWYKGRRADHAARAVLSSLLVDATAGRSIDDEVTRAHWAILGRFFDALRSQATAPGIAADLAAFLRTGKRGREETRRMIGRVIAATAAEGSGEVRRLHELAVAVEVWANEAYYDAHVAGLGDGEPAADGRPDDVDLVAGIAKSLRDNLPDGSTMGRPRALPGGFSKLTLACEIDGLPIVVRADREGSFSGVGVAEEFAVAEILYEAGVPIPRPLSVFPAGAGHRGFMTVSHVEGAPFGFLPEFRDRALCRELGTVLAGVHAIAGTCLPRLDGSDTAVADRVLADVARYERAWRDSGCANPVVEYALHWLRQNVARVEGPRRLVHGDFRPHNILQDSGRITAVLDWEFAKIGHAGEDLAYVRDAADALWSWDEFLDAYVGAGGAVPDSDVLHYYDVYAAIFVVTVLEQVERRFTGAADQPLFMIGSVIQHRPPMLARLAARLGLRAAAPEQALGRLGGREDVAAGA